MCKRDRANILSVDERREKTKALAKQSWSVGYKTDITPHAIAEAEPRDK